MLFRALLPILWAVLLLPSSNIGRFDGLPFDTGPELIGFLLLLPLTVSAPLRRFFRRLIGHRSRAVPVALLALGLLAVGGKVALLASGAYQGFLGCYRYALAPPPTGPCERSFSNPWFRYGVTRIDRVIDFDPETWNLGFLNSSRFDFSALKSPDRPLRQRIPLAVTWRGLVTRPAPWIARVTYVGEVTLRLSREGAPDDASETRLRPYYGELISEIVPIPAGRQVLELGYRFDDGTRWPASRPTRPWATLRFEEGSGAKGGGAGPPAVTARPAALWRALAALVDSAAVILGATMVVGYAAVIRRDWWLVVLVATSGVIVARVQPQVVGLPFAFAVFVALVGLAFTLLGRRWRRRLVVAFFGVAYLNLCLALSSGAPLDRVVYRPVNDGLYYESQARTILDTWSLEGGEPFFRYQPGFRYWRFLERLALGEGDPLVVIAALTLLAWGLLWATARLWPRPPPTWPRAVAFVVAAGLVLGLVTSPPVLWFIQAPLSEYPTWILLPLSFTLLFANRSRRGWVLGGILGGVAVLCRLNHVPAYLGYLVVFAQQRWRESRRAVALTVALVLAMLTLAPVHNRYYGGPNLEAWRVANVNRAALAIAPSRLAQLHRDPALLEELREQLWRVLYRHETREVPPRREPFSRLVMWGLQWLWVGTAIVVLSRRRLVAGTKALILVPLLYFAAQLLYGVELYYPRHIVAGHLALGVSVLYATGRGWTGPSGPVRRRGPALSPPA